MDLKNLLALAVSEGWTVDRNARNHLVLFKPEADPNGRPTVTHSGTASDHRAILNLAGQLRRAGLPVPHKGHTRRKGQR